jgi:hypothetical protein
MDFFQSHQMWLPLLSYLLPFSRTFNCTSKTTGSPKGAEIDPNLPHANKSVTQGSTRILIYIDGLLSVAPNCAKLLHLTSSIFSRTFNCTSKRLVHQKELKLIRTCPTLTKVLLQGSTRILIYIDGLFQSHQTVQAVAILPSSIFPERSIALVKRLVLHQELN